MSNQNPLPGSDLLPTVGEPGSFEWSEEVVEIMVAAWRTKETSEQGFLAAVRAALQYRIWEILSPLPPETPYESLDALIRHKAEPGQAENMQIAIRFSGVQGDAAAGSTDEPPWQAGTLAAAYGSSPAQTRMDLPGQARPLGADEEIAMGNALLDQYGSQVASLGLDPAEIARAMMAVRGAGVGLAPAEPEVAPVSPKRSAAQRKRDKLERTHPDLAEAVEAGDMTLKQAYYQAGIEKEIRALDKLQKLWRSASEEDRGRFLAWLDEQLRAEQRRVYEQEVYGETS